MSYGIGQKRFYSTGDTNNYPNGLTSTTLQDNALTGLYVIKLGIQAPPGTKFWINMDSQNNKDRQGIIGITGIYELDLKDLTYITSLKFDKNSLENISGNSTQSLIIDYVYENIGGVDE